MMLDWVCYWNYFTCCYNICV